MNQCDWINELNTDGYTYVSPNHWDERLSVLRSLILEGAGCDESVSLEEVHHHIIPQEINTKRLKVISTINSDQAKLDWLLEPLAPFITKLFGPDCVRQKRVNLVMHLPQDETSIIPNHSDVLTGNSSFEVTCWIPLTRCHIENTMHLFPYKKGEKAYLMPKENEVVLFKHFLKHGNSLNTTNAARVSLNIRFKSLFSPENKKSLLDYFQIWKMSEFTRIGLNEWKNED